MLLLFGFVALFALIMPLPLLRQRHFEHKQHPSQRPLCKRVLTATRVSGAPLRRLSMISNTQVLGECVRMLCACCVRVHVFCVHVCAAPPPTDPTL